MAKGLGLGLCELLSEIFLKRGDKINRAVWLWCLYGFNQSSSDFTAHEKVVDLHWNSYPQSTEVFFYSEIVTLFAQDKFLLFCLKQAMQKLLWEWLKHPPLKELTSSQPLLSPTEINGHSKRTVESLLSKVDRFVLNFCGSISFAGKTSVEIFYWVFPFKTIFILTKNPCNISLPKYHRWMLGSRWNRE